MKIVLTLFILALFLYADYYNRVEKIDMHGGRNYSYTQGENSSFKKRVNITGISTFLDTNSSKKFIKE